MSDQSQPSTQSPQSPEDLRQNMLDAINKQKETIEELSDEELEMVAGGIAGGPVSAVSKAIVDVPGKAWDQFMQHVSRTQIGRAGGGAISAVAVDKAFNSKKKGL